MMESRQQRIGRLAAAARDEGFCNPIKLRLAAEAREELDEMGVELDGDGWPTDNG